MLATLHRACLAIVWAVLSIFICSGLSHAIERQPNETAQTLSYCVDPDWMPYEAIKAGKHVGISSDYMRIIGEYADIQFTLLPTSSWDETLELLQSGDCDIASMLNPSPERAAYLTFTTPYFQSENVFVTNESIPFVSGYGALVHKRLGIVRNYRHQEYVERYYSDLNVTLVESESAGLLALSAGDIDVLVGSMLSVTSHIQNFGLGNLKVSGLAKPHDALGIGLTKQHVHLLERINRAIAQIGEKQHVELFRRWNQTHIIDQVDYRFITTLAGVLLLISVLIALRHYTVVRFNRALVTKNEMLEALQEELLDKNQQLEFLSTHDNLTRLYNRHFMITRCEQEMLRSRRFDQSTCLILYDIDHFKEINDTYGHSLGDRILCQLTEQVSRFIREVDVLARWGGEEFLILCPQTQGQDALALANRIKKGLAEFEFAAVGTLTCSFGIAEYHHDESFVTWFERTDNAMYNAKEQGRNSAFLASRPVSSKYD